MRWKVALFALLLAACGQAAPESSTDTVPKSTAREPAVTSSTSPAATLPDDGFPSGESALEDADAASFPEPLVPPGDIISGGPPPDGIPPIDDPQFVSVEEAGEWLEPNEPVVTLEIDGDARAYPVQVLIWHEIVNDVVGGTPVSVTYCPLCNSAISYEREIDGHVTTFGTSGRLYASALVMYDRATESLWTHFDGRAVVGLLTGLRLEPVASPLLAWSDFREAHPDGQVLDRESTGFSRAYGTNPYTGYDNPDQTPFLFRGDLDERSRAMQRVVGVRTEEAARAWTLEAISGEAAAATNDTLESTDLVILWAEGQSSALDSDSIDGGRDVGSVGVFSRAVDGQTLTFSATPEGFMDAETGSSWDVTGRSIAGPLSGSELDRLPHLDTFWFAWSTYAPGTDLVNE